MVQEIRWLKGELSKADRVMGVTLRSTFSESHFDGALRSVEGATPNIDSMYRLPAHGLNKCVQKVRKYIIYNIASTSVSKG
jgi:hypothetical protein